MRGTKRALASPQPLIDTGRGRPSPQVVWTGRSSVDIRMQLTQVRARPDPTPHQPPAPANSRSRPLPPARLFASTARPCRRPPPALGPPPQCAPSRCWAPPRHTHTHTRCRQDGVSSADDPSLVAVFSYVSLSAGRPSPVPPLAPGAGAEAEWFAQRQAVADARRAARAQAAEAGGDQPRAPAGGRSRPARTCAAAD